MFYGTAIVKTLSKIMVKWLCHGTFLGNVGGWRLKNLQKQRLFLYIAFAIFSEHQMKQTSHSSFGYKPTIKVSPSAVF